MLELGEHKGIIMLPTSTLTWASDLTGNLRKENRRKDRCPRVRWLDDQEKSSQEARLCTIWLSVYFKFTEKLKHLWKNTKGLFFSSVHVFLSDKYTVFNLVHLIKGKCIVERTRDETEASASTSVTE